MKRLLVLTLLAIAVACGPSLAQAPADRNAPAATTAGTSADKLMLKGNWRASKLMGLDVYNQNNEKLGDVNEIILDKNGKDEAYWRDVGTMEAYYAANMDLVAVDPQLNMYDEHWPIRTYLPSYPPPKFVFAEQGPGARRGQALDSIVCQGSIVSGGTVERSILGTNTRVNSFAHVEDSILLDGVDIGRHARVRRAIIDKQVHIAPGTRIGFDPEEDRARGFNVSEGGVVVIAKADSVDQLRE